MSNHSLPLLENLLESKVTYISGGHAIWPHNSFQVKTIEGRGKVQRLWFAKRNGAIPPHMFLLNTCGVPNCIGPDCHIVSKVAKLSDIVHDRECIGSEPACAAAPVRARCWPTNMGHVAFATVGPACDPLALGESRHAAR